jgi:hypothetical protein
VKPHPQGGPRAESGLPIDPPTAPASLVLEPPRPSLLRRLLAFLGLTGRRPRRGDPLLEVLPEFDVEALLAELRIRERAAENGRHEIPATSDVQPDGPQALIIQRIEQAIHEGRSHLETHLFNLTHRIRATNVVPDCAALEALPAGLEHDLDALIRLHGERVAPLREKYFSLRRQLDEFRARFRLRWEPRAHDSHLLHVGVLLAVVVGESLLNGRYLARADEFGLLGGMTNAFVIALLNVMASFFLGRSTVWLAGARPAFRILGAVAGLAFLVWACLYNLVIAHARDLLGDSIDYGVVLRGIGRIWESPLVFQDVGSWLLLGLGIAFSLIAFADGLRWDDPTPGYGRLDRRVREARADWLHERSRLDVEGRALLARRLDELRTGAERVRQRVEILRNDVEQKRLLLSKTRNFFDYAIKSCNTMLRVYRDLNRQHRTTPPPAYFQQPWSDPEAEPGQAQPALDQGADQARVEAQEAAWRELAARREEIARALEAAHRAFDTRSRALREDDGEGHPAAAARA